MPFMACTGMPWLYGSESYSPPFVDRASLSVFSRPPETGPFPHTYLFRFILVLFAELRIGLSFRFSSQACYVSHFYMPNPYYDLSFHILLGSRCGSCLRRAYQFFVFILNLFTPLILIKLFSFTVPTKWKYSIHNNIVLYHPNTLSPRFKTITGMIDYIRNFCMYSFSQ
jgi:hypothetical protein